jgi:hypothetical protein
MTPDERRDRWMVARARINVARQNANRTLPGGRPLCPGGIRQAIDELDDYLATAYAAATWPRESNVFLPTKAGRR